MRGWVGDVIPWMDRGREKLVFLAKGGMATRTFDTSLHPILLNPDR